VTFPVDPAPDVEFAARIHPKPEGEAIDLSMQIVEAQTIGENRDILMIEMKLPDLTPGEYELEIEAVTKNTSSRFSVRRSLTKR